MDAPVATSLDHLQGYGSGSIDPALNVPVVQRIERLPSKEQIEVRFLAGTQNKEGISGGVNDAGLF